PRLLRSIVERAAALVGTRGGGLYLYRPEEKELELVVSYHLDRDYTGTRLAVGEGLSGEVVLTGEPLIVEDYASWQGKSEKYKDTPLRGIMAVPLRWGEKIVGVLNVTDIEQPKTFTDHDLWLLELFASQAAIAIENARLFVERERRIRQLATLHKVSLEVVATTNLSDVLATVVEKAVQLLEAQAGAIDLFDPETQELEMKVSYGYSKDYSGIRLAFGQGVVGKVAESKQPLIVDDYAHWPERVPQVEKDEIGAALGVPLMRGAEFLGVLTIDRRAS
ncbi:MAG: GAF domain-containing protein, partial [Anaerolineae bacterium]|nr:GAF domain-containing protein [Anaerolineae bacterium]NIQ78639.1 GAF domain-containing protein [Anaerolineae bacterium]